MYVNELMIKDVKCCDWNTTLETAAIMMWDNDCGAIPIIDESSRPVGMVTDRDIAMAAALNHKPLWELRAGDISGHRVTYTCTLGDDIKSALKQMRAHKVRRLPVVNDLGQLQGILSIDDIIACAERSPARDMPTLSYDDTMRTLKAICIHH